MVKRRLSREEFEVAKLRSRLKEEKKKTAKLHRKKRLPLIKQQLIAKIKLQRKKRKIPSRFQRITSEVKRAGREGIRGLKKRKRRKSLFESLTEF